MSYQRLAYDDQDSTGQMHSDCAACASQLPLPKPTVDLGAVTEPAPSLAYEDFPEHTHKPQIEVSQAAAHLASRLHLHLD